MKLRTCILVLLPAALNLAAWAGDIEGKFSHGSVPLRWVRRVN